MAEDEATTSSDAQRPSQAPEAEASSSRSPPSAAAADAGTTTPPQPSSSTSAITTSKRPRRGQDDGASGRGKRMLGMLNATLGQAKRQADANRVDAKRRAAIDARTQARLEKEKKEIEAKAALQRECQKELALCREVLEGEATHRSVRAQKRRLASFLVTSSPGLVRGGEGRGRGSSSRGGGVHGVSVLSIAPSVPSSLPPSASASEYSRKRWPIYYLPRRLTAEQEDALDDQEDRVDADIDEADARWEDRRARLEEELVVVRKRIEDMAREMGEHENDDSAAAPAKKGDDGDTQMSEAEAGNKAVPPTTRNGDMDVDEKKNGADAAPSAPAQESTAAPATTTPAASPGPPAAVAQDMQEPAAGASGGNEDVELRPVEAPGGDSKGGLGSADAKEATTSS